MVEDGINEMAEKNAGALRGIDAADINALISTIENLDKRLERIEERLADPAFDTPGKLFHPSQARFAVNEALAPSNGKKDEKTCSFEPNDRPCDHCSLCSARGF